MHYTVQITHNLNGTRMRGIYLPVIAEENAQQPRPFLRTFLFTKIYARMSVINAYLQILLLDFSPQ